jgi:hypothetical protein
MRAPRRAFAAPFVVTLAAAAAGCTTTDHRHANPPGPITTTDGTAGTADPSATPTPTPTGAQGTWRIELQPDGTCVAAADTHCAPGNPASCNPPRPAAYPCPTGISAEHAYTIQQNAPDDCVLMTPMPACPTGVMCNPPPPQKTACPR